MKKKSKLIKYLKQSIVSAVVLLIFVLVYPFACTIDKELVYEHNGIKVYADADKGDVKRVLDEAIAMLVSNGMDNEAGATVVFCNSRTEYSLKNLFIHAGSLASNRAELGLILFSPVDWKNGVVPAKNSHLNSRSLASIVAHELVHSNQLKMLGFIKYKIAQFTTNWKLEGEAEYVADSSSLPEDKGLELCLNKGEADSFVQDNNLKTEYFYFLSHLRTNYLFDTKHIDRDSFWETDFDLEKLDKEIKSAIQTSRR